MCLRIDREHDALRAEHVRELVDQVGALERRGVDGDLVRAGVEHRLRVLQRTDAAADRERHEDVVGRAARERDHRLAPLVRRGDVEEDELVGAFAVVVGRELDGVARVLDVHEFDALDDAAGVDVEAGDDALEMHAAHRIGCARGAACYSSAARPSANVKRPS